MTLLAGAAGMTLWPVTWAAAAQQRIRAICRDAWGAKPTSGGMQAHSIVRVTVHSGTALWDNRKAPARFRPTRRATRREAGPTSRTTC